MNLQSSWRCLESKLLEAKLSNKMLGTPIVRAACQNDLNDKRERNWNDEVIRFLNDNYEDWRNPQGTFMVPCEFVHKRRKENDGEQAEKQFFDLLQKFGESNSEPMFVICSFKFKELISVPNVESTEEETVRFWQAGEHDFVIIHQKWGIIFFQVKAADKIVKKYHAACRQLEKDKKSLQAYVAAANFTKETKAALKSAIHKFPHFVVMPNCSRGVAGCNDGVFKGDCINVDTFSQWWKDNVAEVGRSFEQNLFEILVMHYIGMAHSFRCTLSESIEEDGEAVEMCTKKQLGVLLGMKSEQWISGPAGSGKTWLLIKKVLMLAKNALRGGNTGEKILVVCYNRPLSVMLSKTFADNLNGNTQEIVRVKTFESLLYELTRSKPGNSDKEKEEGIAHAVERLENETLSVQRYDYIFVDECQDLCGDKWPTLFEKLCKGHDEVTCKNIWFFFDTNQYLRLSSQHLLQQRESLELSEVLRNTEMVFDQSRKYFSSEESITLGHDVHGLEITWDVLQDLNEHIGASCIKKHVEELKRNKVHDKDICIMTQNMDVRDAISAVLKDNGIESQDAEELFGKCEDKVVVESIWRFKGLESKVVILYDPPYCHIEGVRILNVKELLYTAMSRCFCYLVVITDPDGLSALQSQKGMMELNPDEVMEFMGIDDD